MSYNDPTAADLKARFPAFVDVADATVTAILDEALTYVSDAWVTQADYTQGALLYAAHLLTLDGLGAGAETDFARAGLLGFSAITSGKVSVQRDTGSDTGGMSSNTLAQTQYGRRFKELQARNIAGARVL